MSHCYHSSNLKCITVHLVRISNLWVVLLRSRLDLPLKLQMNGLNFLKNESPLEVKYIIYLIVSTEFPTKVNYKVPWLGFTKFTLERTIFLR